MLTLYYGPGACSMAAHIALEETAAKFDTKRIDLMKGEHMQDAYLKVNPRHQVPALRLDDGSVLTENVAVLNYIAERFPAAKLLPSESEAKARALSQLGWLTSAVHPTIGRLFGLGRFVSDQAAQEELAKNTKTRVAELFTDMDRQLAGKEWLAGPFSVNDGYAMVFYFWAKNFFKLPLDQFKNYTAHFERMQKRPSVQRMFAREQQAAA